MVKALGAEIKEFYDNHFPEGFYHDIDDANWSFHNESGDWVLVDSEKYDLSLAGFIVSDDASSYKSFQVVFQSWKKNRTSAFLTIQVPLDQKEEAIRKIQELGYTVK